MDLAELQDFEASLYARPFAPAFAGVVSCFVVVPQETFRTSVPVPAARLEAQPDAKVTEPSSTRFRLNERWEHCLECECDVPDGHGRYRGMCRTCHTEAEPARRRWYADMVERWRKLLAHRYRASVFGGERPDPWQVTLYTLHRRMLGFGTSRGLEGTERAGLADRLGTTVTHLERVLRGTEALSPEVRRSLVERGAQIFAYWRDSEEDDDESALEIL